MVTLLVDSQDGTVRSHNANHTAEQLEKLNAALKAAGAAERWHSGPPFAFDLERFDLDGMLCVTAQELRRQRDALATLLTSMAMLRFDVDKDNDQAWCWCDRATARCNHEPRCIETRAALAACEE